MFLWQAFLKRNYEGGLCLSEKKKLEALVPLLARKRLARLGLWPKDFSSSKALQDKLLEPIFFSQAKDAKKSFLKNFKKKTLPQKLKPFLALEKELEKT